MAAWYIFYDSLKGEQEKTLQNHVFENHIVIADNSDVSLIKYKKENVSAKKQNKNFCILLFLLKFLDISYCERSLKKVL